MTATELVAAVRTLGRRTVTASWVGLAVEPFEAVRLRVPHGGTAERVDRRTDLSVDDRR